MKKLIALLVLLNLATWSCDESAPLSRGFDPPLETAAASLVTDASSPEVGASDAGPDVYTTRHELVTWEVHFSPKGGCTDAIVSAISSATKSVHMQAYSFTSVGVATALILAKQHGVDVEVIVDDSDLKDAAPPTTQVKAIRAGGVPVWSDGKHAIAHNKVLILDGKKVETGSFNYTTAAETSNAENCLFIVDKNLAFTYEQNWQLHKAHSIPVP